MTSSFWSHVHTDVPHPPLHTHTQQILTKRLKSQDSRSMVNKSSQLSSWNGWLLQKEAPVPSVKSGALCLMTDQCRYKKDSSQWTSQENSKGTIQPQNSLYCRLRPPLRGHWSSTVSSPQSCFLKFLRVADSKSSYIDLSSSNRRLTVVLMVTPNCDMYKGSAFKKIINFVFSIWLKTEYIFSSNF